MMFRWLLRVPWPFIAWMGVYLFTIFAVWQLTAHFYHMEWLKYAPEKARDVVREAHRALAESEMERQRLAAECAELRGRVEGAKARLRKSQQLELVEKVGR